MQLKLLFPNLDFLKKDHNHEIKSPRLSNKDLEWLNKPHEHQRCILKKTKQRSAELKEGVKLIAASSIDPKRSSQFLVGMGVLGDSIRRFKDIHATQMYDVDEVSLDSTKQVRSKVLGRMQKVKKGSSKKKKIRKCELETKN
eukprot:8391519-Ditylum_brightwellii.AAC.1